MAKTILILGGLLPTEISALSEQFDIIRLHQEHDPMTALKDNKQDIVGLVSSFPNKITAQLIESLPNLEIIAQSAIGVDNIDLEAAKQRGIVVTNTPDLVTADTADLALGLLISVSRRMIEGDMFVRVGKWANGNMGLGTALTGKTVGIVGLGRIGQAIARRAAVFDMDIAYTGRGEKSDQPYRFVASPEKLAAESDYLVVSCAATPETQNIVNADVLDALGSKGYLINVARGSVVDQEALLIALSNKSIAGAGLDVYENEPHVPEALFSMDNVVLLPHIGTATTETRTKMGRLVIENLLAHFNGEPLKTPVAA